LINKVAVTPANVIGARGVVYVLASGGAIYADKGYCFAPVKIPAARNGVYLCDIKQRENF
jgi:hypothetical protein